VQKQILDLLKSLSLSRGLSVLFISHDLGVVASLCSRIAVMRKGAIVETGSVASVLQSPQAPYTRALLAAMPRRSTRGQKLLTVIDEEALS
jgi:ABC-type dipeptide/oligopeptide/nickel transport system ATPase component